MSVLEVPTPSPLPSPTDSPVPLSERINIATRATHSRLNRLILQRLPLALPPFTDNPSTYVTGLLHIAPIYITFESLWQGIIDTPTLPTTLNETNTHDACDPGSPLLDSKSIPILSNTAQPPLVHVPRVCSRTHSLLSHLRLPGLLRGGRLRADIRILTATPDHKIDERLEAVSQNGKLAAFIAHTRQSVGANPHVLLAYAWVLYMALFSGGRYLRAALQAAGGLRNDFWTRDPSPVRPYPVTRGRAGRRESFSDIPGSPTARPCRERSRVKSPSESFLTKTTPGMQYFNFQGDRDGEDIKLEFKRRIAEAEGILTRGEKEDIIREAQAIFTFMVEMIGELDQVLGTREEDLETARLHSHSPTIMTSRDSVSVAQDRLLKQKTRTLSDKLSEWSPSYLELMVGPFVKQIRDNLPAMDKFSSPLKRGLFKEEARGVTFSREPQNIPESSNQGRNGFPARVPAFLALVSVLVWYIWSLHMA